MSLDNSPPPATAPSFRAGWTEPQGLAVPVTVPVTVPVPSQAAGTGTAPQALTPCLCFQQSQTPQSCFHSGNATPSFYIGKGNS